MPKPSLQQLADQNPVLKMYELGYKPSDVKALFIETLKPYFESETRLRAIDVGLLGVVATNVGRLSTNSVNLALLDRAVRHSWAALKANSQESLKVCAYWEPSIIRSMSEFWSLLNLELDKLELPLEEFRVEIFRNIGSLIEACLKPVSGYTLSQIRVAQGIASPSQAVEQLQLGNIVEILHQSFGDPELTSPSPWGVRLNQWRNVAQHHGTFIRNGVIVCEYGSGLPKKEVELTRQAALDLARRVADVLMVLNTSRLIYMHDNAEALLNHLPAPEIRGDVHEFRIINAVGTQGFEVDRFETTDDQIVVSLRDRTDRPWLEGFIHSSQFLFFIWQLQPKDRLEIRYNSKKGEAGGTAWVYGSEMAKVAALENPIGELAKTVHFEPRQPTTENESARAADPA